MAKEGGKERERGTWDLWKRWLDRNQKVVWVVLLLLLAPFFAFTGPVSTFFTPHQGQAAVASLYGRTLNGAELARVTSLLASLPRLAPELFQAAPLSLGDGKALNFLAYRDKALRLGIRVSDEELAAKVIEIWRDHKAREYAVEESAKTADPKAPAYMRYFEMERLRKEKQEELRANGVFDREEWLQMVARDTRLRVNDFEEFLRDVCLVIKLETYVLNTVQTTPDELYKEYRKEDEKRRLSWVEAKPSAELEEKIAANVKEADLEAYFQANSTNSSKQELYRREFALRATYLILPREHFEAEAAKELTDDDIKRYYEEHINDYRRPRIRSDEGVFLLLSAEEKAARDADVYLPLEEVKEKAREKARDERTQRDLVTFAGQIRSRLFPDKAGPTPGAENTGEKKPPATVEALVKEFPFLKTGTTEFATAADAQKVFGAAHSPVVASWFSKAARDARESPGKTVRIEAPDAAQELPEGKGRIFYARVETRAPGVWRFQEVRDKVKEAYVGEEAQKLIVAALESAATAVNKKAGEEGKKELGDFAAADLEVEVAGGEKLKLKTGLLETSSTYVARPADPQDRYSSRAGGTVMVWKPKKAETEKEEGEKSEGEPEKQPEKPAGTEGGEELVEEAHPDSTGLLKAAYSLDEQGMTAVARESKEHTSYLVRFDGIVYPDPAGFDARREQIRLQLLQKKQVEYFNAWSIRLRQEAYGGTAPVGEGEEIARAGGG